MLLYPARLQSDDRCGYVVTFRDIPEAVAQGPTIPDAKANARDKLVLAIDFYLDAGWAVPDPSPPEPGEFLLPAPTSTELRVATALMH